MIVKIPYRPKNDDKNKRWFIQDNVDRVYAHAPRKMKWKDCDMEIELLSHVDLLELNEDSELTVSILCVQKNNGEEFRILFDTTAFLCNDNGKTIDKFNN